MHNQYTNFDASAAHGITRIDEREFVPSLSATEISEALAELGPSALPELHYLSLKHCLRAGEDLGLALLEDYYQRFTAVFKHADERSSRSEIVRDLMSRDNFDIKIAMVGGRIVGGSHYWLFELSDFTIGFEEHIWVEKEFRGAKVGKALYQEVLQEMKARGADAIMGELKDPFMLSEAEKSASAVQMDPAARVQMWKKLGRLAIDAPYSQPALRPGARPVENMMLTIEAFDPELRGFSAGQYIELLETYAAHIKGAPQAAVDPAVAAIAPEILRRGYVPFIEVDTPRSHLRDRR